MHNGFVARQTLQQRAKGFHGLEIPCSLHRRGGAGRIAKEIRLIEADHLDASGVKFLSAGSSRREKDGPVAVAFQTNSAVHRHLGLTAVDHGMVDANNDYQGIFICAHEPVPLETQQV
jgi:hypothetical protein